MFTDFGSIRAQLPFFEVNKQKIPAMFEKKQTFFKC